MAKKVYDISKRILHELDRTYHGRVESWKLTKNRKKSIPLFQKGNTSPS